MDFVSPVAVRVDFTLIFIANNNGIPSYFSRPIHFLMNC